jgi:hypothetical protein
METGFRYFARLLLDGTARSNGAQHPQYASHILRGQFAIRFLPREEQVHQVVVAQFQQLRQHTDVRIAEVMLISAEKTLEDQVVFQQAAPGAPAKARTA